MSVRLRAEHRQDGASHYLSADIEADGSLRLSGSDMGELAERFSGRDEYEYYKTIKPEHLPRFRELLGIEADEPLLEALAERWSGEESWELERRLRTSDVPVELYVV